MTAQEVMSVTEWRVRNKDGCIICVDDLSGEQGPYVKKLQEGGILKGASNMVWWSRPTVCLAGRRGTGQSSRLGIKQHGASD